MKHLKKIFTLLILGFLAFAPPGTLILIAVLIFSLLGKTWSILGIITISILLIIYGFVYRDKLAENRYLKKILRKFKR